MAIIGLGLMGASLGLALKKGRVAGKVVGFARRAETRRKARAGKIVDIVYDRLEDAVKGSDIVVLCAPVSIIPEMVKRCQPALRENAVITDVGSAKAHIVAAAEKLFRGKKVRFAGSHPIAGSEQHGMEAARPDLYRGAVVAVTPVPRTAKDAVRNIVGFWRALGCEVVMVSPREHDRIIARTSHLPHVIAALLALCVGRKNAGQYGKFCGAGFRDTTRIAEGEPDLWGDILMDTAPFLEKELRMFAGDLKKMIKGLANNRRRIIKKYLNEGRVSRRKLQAVRHFY